jgi:hypothetical protein
LRALATDAREALPSFALRWALLSLDFAVRTLFAAFTHELVVAADAACGAMPAGIASARSRAAAIAIRAMTAKV